MLEGIQSSNKLLIFLSFFIENFHVNATFIRFHLFFFLCNFPSVLHSIHFALQLLPGFIHWDTSNGVIYKQFFFPFDIHRFQHRVQLTGVMVFSEAFSGFLLCFLLDIELPGRLPALVVFLSQFFRFYRSPLSLTLYLSFQSSLSIYCTLASTQPLPSFLPASSLFESSWFNFLFLSSWTCFALSLFSSNLFIFVNWYSSVLFSLNFLSSLLLKAAVSAQRRAILIRKTPNPNQWKFEPISGGLWEGFWRALDEIQCQKLKTKHEFEHKPSNSNRCHIQVIQPG